MKLLYAIGALVLILGGLRLVLRFFEQDSSKPRTLLTCRCAGHSLELAETLRANELRNHVSTDSFYFYWYAERWPLLLWDGKVIASPPYKDAYQGEDPGLPVLPSQRAKLTTVRLQESQNKGDWNLYLPPSQYSQAQFTQIAECLRQNQSALQVAMDLPQKYWWSKELKPLDARAKRLASISWGDVPATLTFSTQRPFNSSSQPGLTPLPETLYIRPDGRWDIALGEFREMIRGHLVPAGDAFRFEMTVGPNPEKPIMADPEYLAAWRSPDGRPLHDFVPLAPIKTN